VHGPTIRLDFRTARECGRSETWQRGEGGRDLVRSSRHLLQAFGDERGGLGNVTAALGDPRAQEDEFRSGERRAGGQPVQQVVLGSAREPVDAFPPGGPKVTYVYDFGADWIHEITRQKMITLEPRQDYPVCVAFGGDSSVLAGILRS
jgi:hypothetical protein